MLSFPIRFDARRLCDAARDEPPLRSPMRQYQDIFEKQTRRARIRRNASIVKAFPR
jgi:hypothetical protein